MELNGEIVSRTDATGAFGVSDVPIEWGSKEIRVTGISYSAVTSEFWMINPNETFDLSVTLDPLPIQLDSIGVVVESRPNVSTRLRPFYERLEKGFGQFVSRSDIEARDPRVVTDMFRGIPGVRVRSTDRGTSIVFPRSLAMRCNSPTFYLDGIMVGGSEVSINDLVSPDDVEGIELYGGIASIPMQFSSGATCGVVAIWTR